MSILDIKDVEAYDQDVVKFLRFYEFPGQTINFEGSAKYKQVKIQIRLRYYIVYQKYNSS
jgi:hypothetical protein